MSKKVLKTKSKGTKDLDINKIKEDPSAYARSVSVDELVSILQTMSDHYYSKAESLVDDDIYDAMYDVLAKRDPSNKYLSQTGTTEISQSDVTLPHYMPSLSKLKKGDEKALRQWFSKYKKKYMVMEKLDGISVLINKTEQGVDIFTKKQSNLGTLIKPHLAQYLIKNNVSNKLPIGTAIRGELVIPKDIFLKQFHNDYKNERSAMSGLIHSNKKNFDKNLASKAHIVCYEIYTSVSTIEEQLNQLSEWNMNVVWFKAFTREDMLNSIDDNSDEDDENKDDSLSDTKKIESFLANTLTARKRESQFLIDGLVLTDNSKAYDNTIDNPKHSMAFKMNNSDAIKTATVIRVIWNVSAYSYLSPIIQINPITLSNNTNVSYITGHNARYIEENKIGENAVIQIEMAGEIIPHVVAVVTGATKADMPEIETKWSETNVDLIVVNPDEETKRLIKIKQNLHFFRKLGVKFLSEGLITKLYDSGYKTIESIAKASSSKNEDLYEIDRLGKKMVDKIYSQIDKSFLKIKLPELMSASLKFGRGLGVRKFREILKKYPDLLKMVKEADHDTIRDSIIEVPGFSWLLATKVADNLKKFVKFLDDLNKKTGYKIDFNVKTKTKTQTKKTTKATKENNIFEGQTIVMTGFRSEPIADFVESQGGKIGSGVSKNTTLLIYNGDKISSKIEKAQTLGIKIMKREEFEKLHNIEQ